MPHMPRDTATRLGRETVAILSAGRYVSSKGVPVDISAQLKHAVGKTKAYPPDREVDVNPGLGLSPTVSVENQSIMHVAQRLAAAGPIAALNFASSTSPGGGFLSGARAQEEAIARSSGLFACLQHQPMYAFHRARLDAMSTHYVIYSPEVPVFRTDDGELLDEPWLMSIITCPAVNATALRKYAPERMDEVAGVMRDRAHKVLATAVHHGHRRLILGAWGCGAFGISGTVMAEIFRELLTTTFAPAFELVTFAITDWSEEQRFIGPFRQVFERERPVGDSLRDLQRVMAEFDVGLDDRSAEFAATLRDSGSLRNGDWPRILDELRHALRFLATSNQMAAHGSDGRLVINIDADPRNADWLKSVSASRLSGYHLPLWASLWLWRIGRERGPRFWSNVGAVAERLGCEPVPPPSN